MKITQLAHMLGGTVEGSDVDITGLNGIEGAKPGDLTFATDDEKLSFAEKSGASAVLTGKKVRSSTKPLIRVDNPKLTFLIIYNMFNKPKDRGAFTHPTAAISDKACIGKNVWIGSHVSIEDDVEIADNVVIESNCAIKSRSRIGSGSHIYPNVTLYDGMVIGKNVTIHSGSVIGADGFGYVKEKGKIYKFPQLGKVVIGDDVEIGANTTVDRGSLSDTIIGAGSKIDNQCQIAHNVKLGKNTIMAGQSGISGSTTVGDDVTMGGKAGIADNLTVGSNVIIAAGSGVIDDIKDGEVVWGFPKARPIGQTKRQLAVLGWMTKHFKELSKLIKEK